MKAKRIVCVCLVVAFANPGTRILTSQETGTTESDVPIAWGRIRIVGNGVECKKVTLREGVQPQRGNRDHSTLSVELCNTTWIRIQIDGTSVTVKARKKSTASGVGAALAARIASHPKLSKLVRARASGNIVHVSALQPGMENSYPWLASCSHIKRYFDNCAFRAQLSPVATLGPLPKD